MNTRSLVLRAIPSACLLLSSASALAQQVINGTTETVPGSKPNPWNTGTLTVGTSGTGTLNIDAGGVVTSTAATLGSTSTGIGTVSVSGSGARWTNTTLSVGNLGTGTLNILNGGSVNTTGSSADIGFGATGTGTLNIDGAGSSLVATNALRIGSGDIRVQNGGLLRSVTSTQNKGTMLITGSGTALSLDNNLFLNNDTALTIADRATATNFRVWIGDQTSANGETARLIVQDGGSWTLDNAKSPGSQRSVLTVGRRANGELLIESGGGVTGLRTTIGGEKDTGSTDVTGVATVMGAGSLLTMAEDVIVGDLGKGTLNILQGGVATSGSGMIGSAASSNSNVVVVDGNGSLWELGNPQAAPPPLPPSPPSRSLVVGNNSSGNSLTVSGGGAVKAHDNLTIGRQLGSNANRLTVTDTASQLTVGNGFAVGRNGANNTALISSGALLETAASAWIGGASGSPAINNRVTVEGAATRWQLGGNLYIGSALAPLSDGVEDTPPPVATVSNANNTLLISGGARVTQTGGSATIGGGNLLDVGAGSTFTTDGALAVQTGARLSLATNSRVKGASLNMSSGSELDVFAQEGNSSLLSFSGKADLGGTLSALIDGRSSLSQRFLVLEAGEVKGTFDRAVLDDYSANLAWELLYTPQDVWLELKAEIGDVDGLNENQHNVAESLDDFFNGGGAFPPSFFPIFGLTGDQLAQALSQLSGEVGASGGAAAAVSANSSFLRSMLAHPCTDDTPEDPRQRCRNSVWAAGFGSTASLPGNDAKGSHDTTTSVAGIATGWDHADDDMRVGVAIAGGGTGWNLDGSGMGSGDGTFLQLGAYATKMMGGAYASLAGAYALQGMSTQRRVTALESETLEADVIANAVAGRGEAGYRFGISQSLGLTPYAALQGQAIHTPSYDETGTLDAGSYALSYNATTTTAVRSELGFGLDMATDAALFSARAAWAHDWLNDAYARAGFQSLQGTSFVVNGAEAPADLALVSASANVALSRQAALTARFDGEFGSDYQSYAGTLALTWSW